MEYGKAIYSMLYTGSLLYTTGGRIYPDVAAQEAGYPYVTYSISNTEPNRTKTGTSQLDIVRVEISGYAKTYSALADVADQVRTNMDNVTGTYVGLNVVGCSFDQEGSEYTGVPEVYAFTQYYTMLFKY